MRDDPFLLLDDARKGIARLYERPIEIVTAADTATLRPALERIRTAGNAGLHAAGYLTYEAGAALMPRPAADIDAPGPLLWFGLFETYERLDAAALEAWLPDSAGARAVAPRPTMERAAYDDVLAKVLDLIRAGDIYQANVTLRAEVAIAGDPLALYARLRRHAAAAYGAVVHTGAATLLSLSPELFFAVEGSRLHCRPMKGTAQRGETPEEDRAAADRLRTDAKQRAENLMIVDLMRNDLSRVAIPGSVAVPNLFTVETYPTIHQLTSTVTATLADACDAVDVIAALMPCGSIIGAPKQRAMEVIASVESSPRGVYTGAIGHIDASGDAMFNVAIRTLVIPEGASTAILGLGSGIVADSRADEEWAECGAKGAFVTAGQRRIDLIETMGFDPDDGITLLERHLERMRRSAVALGFRFDRHAARNELQAATFRLREAKRIRLLLSEPGGMAIEVAPYPPRITAPLRVAIVPLPVPLADYRLHHKTSDRAFYDVARRTAGTDEVIFLHDGALTEGSFTSLFVSRPGGLLATPPLVRGLLPGVLRAELLATGRAAEDDVTPADLAAGFFLGNALRGLMPAVLAVAEGDAQPL